VIVVRAGLVAYPLLGRQTTESTEYSADSTSQRVGWELDSVSDVLQALNHEQAQLEISNIFRRRYPDQSGAQYERWDSSSLRHTVYSSFGAETCIGNLQSRREKKVGEKVFILEDVAKTALSVVINRNYASQKIAQQQEGCQSSCKLTSSRR
jgi:hypothetical protein